MIQSGKFDSLIMNIKTLTNSVLIFIIKRLIEISGICISILGFLLLLGLVSYSPSDPNFIFPENTEIKNWLGSRGSYISDLFFQSIGLIAYLIPITYIITGVNIFRKKEIFPIIESSFFIILYSLIGSLFFSFFYKDTYALYINGNGGFVGTYLNKLFFISFLQSYENIFYFLFVLLIIIFFLISINFQLKSFVETIKNIFRLFFKDNKKIILMRMK